MKKNNQIAVFTIIFVILIIGTIVVYTFKTDVNENEKIEVYKLDTSGETVDDYFYKKCIYGLILLWYRNIIKKTINYP